jgi:hypothetical protein
MILCHHFHDVSCKSGSKIDVRARVSGVMEHAYFEALARDEGCDYCAGRRQVARLAPDLEPPNRPTSRRLQPFIPASGWSFRATSSRGSQPRLSSKLQVVAAQVVVALAA